MTWQTTYPTLADVSIAGPTTLDAWDKSLPPPQTDVERTVRRRIGMAMDAAALKEIRRVSPEVADRWNKAMSELERVTGIKAPRT